jgi:hypothetical protein
MGLGRLLVRGLLIARDVPYYPAIYYLVVWRHLAHLRGVGGCRLQIRLREPRRRAMERGGPRHRTGARKQPPPRDLARARAGALRRQSDARHRAAGRGRNAGRLRAPPAAMRGRPLHRRIPSCPWRRLGGAHGARRRHRGLPARRARGRLRAAGAVAPAGARAMTSISPAACGAAPLPGPAAIAIP